MLINDKEIRNGKTILEGTRLTPEDILAQTISCLLYTPEFIQNFQKFHYNITKEQILEGLEYFLDNGE